MDIKRIIAEKFSIATQNYRRAEQRFEEVLRTRLGVSASAAADKSISSKQKLGSIHFGAPEPVNRENVTAPSGATAADIERALAGTRLSGLGEAFSKAEQAHGVNAWFLAAIAALESGYGTSQIANDKNNLFGFCAYDDSPYTSAKRFKTKTDGIGYVADFLSREYLSANGAYYKGLSVDSVGRSYATDPNWADKVSVLMNQLSEKAGVSSAGSSDTARSGINSPGVGSLGAGSPDSGGYVTGGSGRNP